MTEGALDDQLAALVGKPIGDAGPSLAPDPVNEPMIRHWAAAFEDWNPVYTDADAARGVAFRRDRRAAVDAADLDDGDADVSPAWPSAAVRRPKAGGAEVLDRARRGRLRRHARDELGVRDRALPARGRRRVGHDRRSSRCRRRSRPASVPGYFVTWVTTYTDADGEVVGRQTFRILKFQPGGWQLRS